jgi:hypothetical protein
MRIPRGVRIGRHGPMVNSIARRKRRQRLGLVSYEAESDALFAAMTPAPDATRQGHIDTLIKSLKSGGVWAKLDSLSVLAAHAEQPARLNWKNATAYTQAGTLIKLTDRYWKGTVGGGAIDNSNTPDYLTGFGALNAQTLHKKDDGHLGTWSLTNVSSGSVRTNEFGTTTAWIGLAVGGGVMVRSQNTTFVTYSGVSFLGHTLWSRSSSSEFKLFKNGSVQATTTNTSAALENTEIRAMGRVGNLLGTAGGNELAIVHSGAALTDAEVASAHVAFAAYLTAIGAIS